ncbi:S8 family serine peptidase [Tahibacter sp.]|uniref:S8 family serine peptidase n=1 Tax=Tahibacter sp. TaxID=2056211 RepID=UPI0028C37FE6|nr:S8 family serine peptidase [Tahibacter sp.]
MRSIGLNGAVAVALLVVLLPGCAAFSTRDGMTSAPEFTAESASARIPDAAASYSETLPPPQAPPDFGACERPSDYIVEAANTQLAATLAQQYADLFGAKQAGSRVLFQRRAGDTQQQDELDRLARDPALVVTEEARFELDGVHGGDPLQFRNEALWKSIHMPEDRDLQAGEPVNVAVIDGPVRTDHPDLDNVVHIEPRLRDVDGNCGHADCCPQVAAPAPFWHGTRIAGVIGARRGNDVGASGIAPVRSLVSINANLGGCAGEFSLAAALHCAIEYRDAEGRPARVANISMGSTQRLATTAVTTALQRARSANLLVVASAGNRGTNIDTMYRWPSSVNAPNVITVQSRRYDGQLLKNANFGFGTVDLAAPAPTSGQGGSLCAASTRVTGDDACTGDYADFAQSSAAAAVVTGAAALVWSDRRFGNCSAEQMRTLLLTSRSHCLAGRSYRNGNDYEVCQLDLAFLSAEDTAGQQALCGGGAR